jgi:hypothetical protein
MGVVPIGWSVCGSYTSQPWLEKCNSKPSSQSWPIDKRLKERSGTKYVAHNQLSNGNRLDVTNA